MLKERLAAKVLDVGAVNPARDNCFVREPVGVLKIQEPGHQPRRACRPSAVGGEEPGPFALEELPVDQRRQLYRSWRMSMISTRRGRRRSSCSGVHFFGFMTAPEFARFLQQIYQILWAEATKYPRKPFCFRRLGIVQSELNDVERHTVASRQHRSRLLAGRDLGPDRRGRCRFVVQR